MSAKFRTRDGVKEKRCSSERHTGDRWLPVTEYQSDRGNASGLKSACRGCTNKNQRDYDREHADEGRVRSETRQKRHVAEADARDDKMLDDLGKAGRKVEAERIAAAEEAERLRAEREKRLADDFMPLKVDDLTSDADFDTSIANRADMSKKQRREASKEKRQEYSQAMGDHMSAVRKAAVRESLDDTDMLRSIPADSGTYIGALAEQERRFGNRRLARSISLFAAGEEQARRLWMQACRQYLTGRVTPTGYAAKRPASKPMQRSVCLLLSDLHLGADLLAAENPMPFRKVEEARRLEYILRQTIDYKPQYRSHSELVLLLNGDMIEGLLLHDFRDGSPLTEQKVVFQRYMERFIGECAGAFPKVRVVCQPGNHGRDKIRHPGRATSAKWDSHEASMYYALSRACTSLKNVTWDLGFRAVSKVELHGSILGLTHGDTEVKLGDPDTKAKDNGQILDAINTNRTYGVEFDAWAFGHFHKPRYLPRRTRVIFNGALVPPNGHARTSGYISESCGQFLWEAVEGYPIGDVRYIEVGRSQDKDERLGKIIEPFRFDLENPDERFPR